MTTPARFDPIAARYERDSSAQRAGADLLLELAAPRPGEAVLDVGCGTGQLAERLARLGCAPVVGVDPSPRMVAEARARGAEGVRFERAAAEEVAFERAFDLVLSNSALQWFHDPQGAVAAMRRALRRGGRVAIQAPATLAYVPEFVAAMAEVAEAPATRQVFARWRTPWTFLERAEDYAALLAGAGLAVTHARIEELLQREDLDGAMRVFGSGAEAGYLEPACYPGGFPAGYPEAVRAVVRASFARRLAADGRLALRFRRVFLLGTAA